jgi:hypothetical protein
VAEPLTEIGVPKHPRAEVAAYAGVGAAQRGLVPEGWRTYNSSQARASSENGL